MKSNAGTIGRYENKNKKLYGEIIGVDSFPGFHSNQYTVYSLSDVIHKYLKYNSFDMAYWFFLQMNDS